MENFQIFLHVSDQNFKPTDFNFNLSHKLDTITGLRKNKIIKISSFWTKTIKLRKIKRTSEA
jgi:hypothetical protein